MMKIDDVIKSRFNNENHRAVVNLRYTSNWIASQHNSHLAQFGLSLPQFNVLRILRGAKEKISVKIVKDRMIEKSPNTTRLFDKLVEKEYISRTRCEEDRRVVYLKISDLGLKVLSKIDDIFEEVNFSDNLSENEAATLSNLLDKLRG